MPAPPAVEASTPKLMHRIGHGSMRAGFIYRRATGRRDREIADACRPESKAKVKQMGPQRAPASRLVSYAEVPAANESRYD